LLPLRFHSLSCPRSTLYHRSVALRFLTPRLLDRLLELLSLHTPWPVTDGIMG